MNVRAIVDSYLYTLSLTSIGVLLTLIHARTIVDSYLYTSSLTSIGVLLTLMNILIGEYHCSLMCIILHSYERKIHLSLKVVFTLGSCLSWTYQFLHQDMLFFHLQWRIVPLQIMPNGILRWLIDFIYITVCIIGGGTVRELSFRAPTHFEIGFCLSAVFKTQMTCC